MKLIRFGAPGAEKPGLLLGDGARVDASAFGSDWDERFFGSDGLARLDGLGAGARRLGPARARRASGSAPASRGPRKIVCIGLNYADHARETGAKIPDEPVIFFKATTALCGPNDDLVLPRGSVKTDWEVELAVVDRPHGPATSPARTPPRTWPATRSTTTTRSARTSSSAAASGRRARARTPSRRSARSSRPRTRSATRRSSRSGSPSTARSARSSNTDQMIFDVPTLVSYLSRFMTLLPGDVISTGTPPGVGLGFEPARSS